MGPRAMSPEEHGISLRAGGQERGAGTGPEQRAGPRVQPTELCQLPALPPSEPEAELQVLQTLHMCQPVHQGHPGARRTRTSCRACWSLLLPRRRGWASGGQRGGGGPGTGEDCRRGRSVWQLQRLHECVQAASAPQRLGGHAPREELRNRGRDVFVVTEVLQTQKEVEVTRTHKHEGSGQFSLPGAVCFQGEGKGHLSRKKTVTIPSGSVLAFRVAQLVFTGPEWDILFVPEKRQRTFMRPQTAGDQPQRPSSLSTLLKSIGDHLRFLSDGLGEDQVVSTEDFQGLQAEVKAWAGFLENLSKTLCEQLLRGLGQVLRDELALQTLEESLEQGLCCGRAEPLQGPAGHVLECLVLPCRTLVEELAGPVTYLLGALAALSEAQRVLLAEVLEASALLEPLKLVEKLLEQSSPWKEPRALSLPPGLLAGRWGPEVPAWILLEASGLELQVNAPQVCWKPEAQGCACALYACLALLSKLSQLC
ncbi:gasdermin-D isoform X3 [Artibeus jamaicensis]|uniref:gasdermin-D isoform X3 n=1 Tax=Artibeus jamaicensis TaxID=9417 RepID=UPI00235AC75B|nr:gasdermin-D isoform X3 [Artibeus jamaicensis]